MIDEVKLREKYNLSIKEYEAICERTDELVAFEEKSGLVISRCNGTLKSTKQWMQRRLSKEESEHCLEFLKNNGGYCNCEILFNVLPRIKEMREDVQKPDRPCN